MLEAVTEGLDAAESLKPGHGLIELGMLANQEHAGATLGAEARLSDSMSAFAEAQALWDWRAQSLDYQALGGLRWRW